jgi:glycosyltransferase involved in cell wall biosynthesis
MGIFVAVPVYDGMGLVAESLRSIQAQDHGAFIAHISVDGDDRGSARACEPFPADPRFRMTVQPRRLGWAANLNWLMDRGSEDFFCYWQQDDLCDASYLRVLAAEAGREPRAVCVYADLQWFGTRSELVSTPSSTGCALERVLDQIEHGHDVPFRGLVRRTSLQAVGGIRLTPQRQRAGGPGVAGPAGRARPVAACRGHHVLQARARVGDAPGVGTVGP